MKKIITDEEKLSIRSDEVDPIKQSKLVRGVVYELQQVIKDRNLPYLAAINIGLPYRIFIINFNGNLQTFINPMMSEGKNFIFSKETNPSIPDKEFVVARYSEIDVMYQTPKNKIESKKLLGYAAYLFQQGLDALEGVFISDIGFEIDEDFKNASEEEQAEVLKMWCEVLGDRLEDNQAKIDADPELKKMQDAYNFQVGVAKGKIQTEEFQLSKEDVKTIKAALEDSEKESPDAK